MKNYMRYGDKNNKFVILKKEIAAFRLEGKTLSIWAKSGFEYTINNSTEEIALGAFNALMNAIASEEATPND